MKTIILAATAALTLTAPAVFAATVAEMKASCAASGGTLGTDETGGYVCRHPGADEGKEVNVKTVFTFKDEQGLVWTVTTPGIAPPSKLHMSADAARACPSLKIKLEASKKGGPPMTAEQKFRGDKRWHVVCVR